MNENVRKKAFCVIAVECYENGQHDIQTNTGWAKNPYGKEYAVVPDELVPEIKATRGYCDIVLNDEGTEVVSFTAREIPVITDEEAPEEISLEQIRADIDYIAIMRGVDL